MRGGLGIATVAANAAFAAVTGSSIASASVFTRVAVPEMIRYNYNKRFAVGVVAGSSVLGMIIPPSVMLIIYAFVAEQSIGEMFLAGVVPGLLLSAAYIAAIWLMTVFMPKFVGAGAFASPVAGTRLMGIGETDSQNPANLDPDRGGARRHLHRLFHAVGSRRHRRVYRLYHLVVPRGGSAGPRSRKS